MTGIDPAFGTCFTALSPVAGGTITPQELLMSWPEASWQPGVVGAAGNWSCGGAVVCALVRRGIALAAAAIEPRSRIVRTYFTGRLLQTGCPELRTRLPAAGSIVGSR